MAKILTIDVWDTLLRREVHPDAVKLATSKYFFKHCSGYIKKLIPDHMYIHKLRHVLEERLYLESLQENHYGEYHIEQVIRRMATILCPDKSEHDELIEEIINYEVDFEKHVVNKDLDIEDTLAAFDTEEVMFLSDFYMSASSITELLIYADVDKQYIQGISSCDVGCNKHTGSLYKLLHQKFGISAANHIHIGDNKLSDFNVPRSLGIKAHLYRPRQLHRARCQRERLYKRPQSHFSSQIKQKIKNCRLAQRNTDSQNPPYQLGIRYSQLFISFIQSVNEEVLKYDIDEVYFLSREGVFLKQIYAALNNDVPGKFATPQGKHLEVSRASTFLASLRQINLQEMMRVWCQIEKMSLQGLFFTLNINTTEILTHIRHKNIDIHKRRKRPWRDPEVIALFCDEVFIDLCECERVKQRSSLMNYLVSQGFDGKTSKNILFVDIGWRGSIQDNISRLFPEIHFYGKYLCMDKIYNYQEKNVSKSAYLYNVNNNAKDSRKLKDIVALEVLCNSADGSVVGYEEQYPYRPFRRRVDGETAIHHEFCSHFQTGVIEVANIVSKFLYINTIRSIDMRTKSLSIYNHIVTISHTDLRRVFKKGVAHNQLFGFGEVIIKKPRLPVILRKVLKKLTRMREFKNIT